MNWFKDYYHGAYGMVVMDENGIDKLLVGDKLANPNRGVRITDVTGLTWKYGKRWNWHSKTKRKY